MNPLKMTEGQREHAADDYATRRDAFIDARVEVMLADPTFVNSAMEWVIGWGDSLRAPRAAPKYWQAARAIVHAFVQGDAAGFYDKTHAAIRARLADVALEEFYDSEES